MEAQAAVDAAVVAGARSVYLIEEPVAAAIGAGIDISKPEGNIILDIGGGTADIAVLSLNGIVCKNSIKMAGDKFNTAIIRYIRAKYNVLIGERMAENVKIAIASADEHAENLSCEIKGRNLAAGLPIRMEITRKELYPTIFDCVTEIRDAVHSVIEKTPPELAGDLRGNGLVMTGAGRFCTGWIPISANSSEFRCELRKIQWSVSPSAQDVHSNLSISLLTVLLPLPPINIKNRTYKTSLTWNTLCIQI